MWGSVDGDHIFSPSFVAELVTMGCERYEWMNKALVLETEHLSS
jgi:hypothetical protein